MQNISTRKKIKKRREENIKQDSTITKKKD